MTVDWNKVSERLIQSSRSGGWRYGQADSLRFLASRLPSQPGVLIADEVGLGKTRVAMAVIDAVLGEGGAAAAVVPPGLLFQWEAEWAAYKRSLPEGEEDGGLAPLRLRRFHDIFWENPPGYPLAGWGRWLLLSHSFGLPRLRNNSLPWRYRLPLLARALHLKREGICKRPRASKFWKHARKSYKGYEECWEFPCKECPPEDHCWCAHEKSAATYLATTRELDDIWEELKVEQLFKRGRVRDYYQGEGRPLLSRMLGTLLGTLDLVVIDEAHKSRDHGARSTVLGRLLKEVLQVQGRVLGMTATPVELGASQWDDILQRIGVVDPPMTEIREFTRAHRQASRHPDQELALRTLMTSARSFERSLRPHVTRRRRVQQEDMKALIGETDRGVAHPHRELSRLTISYDCIQEEWRPIVLGLEGLGLASKGLGSENAATRMVDIRYASGHLSPDVDLTSGSEEEGAEDEWEDEPIWQQARRRRVAFWRRLVSDHLGRTTGSDPRAGMAQHPRIVGVANHIEQITWGGTGDGAMGEKVLVFGFYNLPLRGLRDMLNRRAVLRMLDRGQPVPGGLALAEDAGDIWREYQAVQAQRTQDPTPPAELMAPPFTEALAEGVGSPADLGNLLKQAGRRYDNIRDRLVEHIDQAFLKSLPGDAAIMDMGVEAREELCQLLRTRIVNTWLTDPRWAEELAGGRDRARRRGELARQLATEIWVEYLKCHVETGNLDDSVEARTEWSPASDMDTDEDGQLRRLDRLGDNLSPSLIVQLIEGEADHGSGRRFSAFARMMSGQVRMETRHVLQAQFNRPEAFPRVLIAQSQVGREGLNLHEACRHVILFHSEWNPAIIEQQIGRVDRIFSLWEGMALEWKKNGGRPDQMPKIVVEHVVFKGTYDEYQAAVFEARQRNMRAHLFGQLIDEHTEAMIPKDLVEELQQAAPDFAPPKE